MAAILVVLAVLLGVGITLVTAFLMNFTLGAWVLVVLGLFVWWCGIAMFVANAITWTLPYALGISRDMRKVVRLEHRMEVASNEGRNALPTSLGSPPERESRPPIARRGFSG